MKTVTYTRDTSGSHSTSGNIYADGTQVRFGDGRDDEEQYAPQIHNQTEGATCSFIGCTSGRRIRGEVMKIESHTTGAETITLGVGYPQTD